MKTKLKRTRDKRQSLYPYYGLGFRVDLRDVPLMKIENEWAPDVNFNSIEDHVAWLVPLKPAPLTGAEIYFLRRHLKMTLNELAAALGVTRQGVIKWENTEGEPAG